jgi:hypothetical protein
MGGLIGSDSYQKKLELEGHTFILSGAVDEMPALMADIVANRFTKEVSCRGVMVDPEGRAFMVGSDEDEHILTPLIMDVPMAWGSGRDFAIAAMDFGCSAKEAVKYARTRCTYTGGKVRTFKLTQ